MSPATIVTVNAALDVAVLVALAVFSRIPFGLVAGPAAEAHVPASAGIDRLAA